jgi:hypothetical protein
MEELGRNSRFVVFLQYFWMGYRFRPDQCVNQALEVWVGEQEEDQASPPWFKRGGKEGRGAQLKRQGPFLGMQSLK